MSRLVSILLRVTPDTVGGIEPTLRSLAGIDRHGGREVFLVPGRSFTPPASSLVRCTAAAGAAGLAEALGEAAGEWITLLDAGDRLFPEWAHAVAEATEADVLYGDSLRIDPATGRGSRFFFRPGWSPELLLGTPYLGRAVAVRRSIALQAGGFREGFAGAEDYDFLLRATEETTAIRHVARPLWAEGFRDRSAVVDAERGAIRDALRRRLTPGEVEPLGPRHAPVYRVRREHEPDLVSIIIPTRDRLDLLEPCVSSVTRHTRVAHEILIVDNDSTDPATLRYLSRVPATVLRVPGEFDFATINNVAAERARGRYLLFLNNDTVVHEDGWIPALLEQVSQPEIGAAGAKLHYPDGSLQHTGMIIHPGARIDQVLTRRDERSFDHPYFLRAACEVSAVTGACMMIRRELFLRLGGFDPTLRIGYNDIDLCFRLRRHGYRIILTPFSTLTHHECGSRRPLPPLADEVIFRCRWTGTELDRDPYLVPVCRTLGYGFALPHGVHVRPELAPLSDATAPRAA